MTMLRFGVMLYSPSKLHLLTSSAEKLFVSTVIY